MASRRPKPVPAPFLALLVVAGAIVGVRAVQLAATEWMQTPGPAHHTSLPARPQASQTPMQAFQSAPPATHPPIAQSPILASPKQASPRQAVPPNSADNAELRAIIAAACPHALEMMDAEGAFEPLRLPPIEQEESPPMRVAMRPSPAIQGLRVAQNDDAWLVPPDNWYAPEDRSKQDGGEGKTEEEEPESAEQPTPVNEETPEPDAIDIGPEPASDEPEPPVVESPRDDPAATPVTPSLPSVDDDEPASPSEMPVDVPAPATKAPPHYEPAGPAEPVEAVQTPEVQTPQAPPASDDPAEHAGPELLPSAPPKAQPTQPVEPLFPAPKVRPVPQQPAPQQPVPQQPAPPVRPASPVTPSSVTPSQPTSPPQAVRPVAPGVPSPHSAAAAAEDPASKSELSSIDAHRDLFAKNCFPSARECGACHKKHYDEWRISSHAYAFVSPMFQKFEQKITNLSQGTVGYFCYRCHSPVATTIGEHRATPVWDMPNAAREGVTCVACHRVNERYTKANGERRIVPGDIHAPVYGNIGGNGVAAAIAKKDHYKVKTSPDQKGAGQAIHLEGRYFDQLGRSEFCSSCHQVTVHPGIKLEVVWEQYRQSPACKKGVTCQDCHMGLKPGEASGYEVCSIAEVGGKSVCKERKHANHIFYGPNYSISHPAVFPDNKDADRWEMKEWLRFNWRAGWGTDKFEDAVEDGQLVVKFPKEWDDVDDRYDAREIIEDNQKTLERKQQIREEVMNHSLRIAGPFFKHAPTVGRDLRMYYDVTNLNEGHNVLTASLGAQPQLWANIVLIGPGGQRLWETGYTDSDGDVCDIHSRDVRTGRAPFDHQLFNLQAMFLITGATGTDREMPLPVNVDIDQLPFLRPGAIPITTTNHPPFIRMESRSIAPLGTKRVNYKIPGELLCRPGKYRLSFRMRNRIEPIWFMRFCDATDEMVRRMNEGILDVQPRSVEFWVR